MNKKGTHVIGAVVALLLASGYGGTDDGTNPIGSICQASEHMQYIPHAGYVEGTTYIIGLCSDGRIKRYQVGTGHLAHLGNLTWVAQNCTNPTTGEADGAADTTAANGDHVYSQYHSLAVFDSPTSGHWYQEEWGVGGTGRFEGKEGGITLQEGVFELQFQPGNPYPITVWSTTNIEGWFPVGGK